MTEEVLAYLRDGGPKPKKEYDAYGCGVGGYSGLYASISPHVAVEHSLGSYQGDTRVLFIEPDGRVGYLLFGWGSCSGCDAYEACTSWEDIKALRDDLARSVVWLPSARKALAWFNTRDWKANEAGDEGQKGDFVREAKLAMLHLLDDSTLVETFLSSVENK